MILMGDEVGRTQWGNNNTYCQDNELNWLDWSLVDINADIYRFFSACIYFRKAHPILRNKDYFQYRDYMGSGFPDISWHGTQAWNPDWSEGSRTLAFMLDGKHARSGSVEDDSVYVAMNMHWEGHDFEVPGLPDGKRWHVFANTGAQSPEDAWSLGMEPLVSDPSKFFLGPRSVAILVSKPNAGR